MKCPSCGTKNKDGMKFCKICGASLETTNNNTMYEDGYKSDTKDIDTKYSNKKEPSLESVG